MLISMGNTTHVQVFTYIDEHTYEFVSVVCMCEPRFSTQLFMQHFVFCFI